MPARTTKATFHCFCASCILLGGVGPDNQPLGKLFPASQRVAHLARVRAEEEAEAQWQSSTTTNPRDAAVIQEASSSIFALTLTDNGPDLNTQCSRLWTSRDEIQVSFPPPSMPDAPPV